MTPASRSRSLSRAALVLAVLGAVVVRVALNDARLFSAHDEGVYLEVASAVAEEGPVDALRRVLTAYLAQPRAWLYPPPIRWGQHLLGGLACALAGASYEALTALSTLASAAVVVLAAALTRRAAGTKAAAAAVVLLAASPLWLHLGRRALADAPYAATALAATWAFFEATRPGARRGMVALAVALLAAQMALKEGGALLLAALPLVHVALAAREGGRAALLPALGRGAALVVVAGGLAWLGFSLLAGSPWAYLRVTSAIQQAGPHNEYLRTFQSGPPWRYLIDLALLSPGLVVVAPVALARALRVDPRRSPRARLIAALALLVVVYAALLVAAGAAGMGYNARYLLPLDAPLRALAGLWLVRAVGARGASRARQGGAALGLAAWVASDAWLFQRVFLEKGVYDPVTDALARALGLLA